MEAVVGRRMLLRPGTEHELLTVLAASRQVWGRGISAEDYIEFHRLIRSHPWSDENFRHLVLVDDLGEIVSSCKIYYHELKLGSDIFRLVGLAAVFTMPEHRSRGYATQMLEHILDEVSGQGFDLVMLFSDIGIEFYARLGLEQVRKYDPVYAFLNPKIKPAEIAVFEYLPEELLNWHLAYAERQKFSLVRTGKYFQLLSDRIDWHRKYMGFREQRVIVSHEDQGYVWADLTRWRLIIRDFASASENPKEALARILSALQARFNFREVAGWLPDEFDYYSFFKLKEKRLRTKTVLMFTALNERGRVVLKLAPEEIHFWLADYF